MSRFKTIQYAVDEYTGMVWSKVGEEFAIPILDYEGMKPENSFETKYNLEKVARDTVSQPWHTLRWTKKIPLDIRNRHRAFWGMKPIKPNPKNHKLVLISTHDAQAECSCGRWSLTSPTPDTDSAYKVKKHIKAMWLAHRDHKDKKC